MDSHSSANSRRRQSCSAEVNRSDGDTQVADFDNDQYILVESLDFGGDFRPGDDAVSDLPMTFVHAVVVGNMKTADPRSAFADDRRNFSPAPHQVIDVDTEVEMFRGKLPDHLKQFILMVSEASAWQQFQVQRSIPAFQHGLKIATGADHLLHAYAAFLRQVRFPTTMNRQIADIQPGKMLHIFQRQADRFPPRGFVLRCELP